MTQNPQIPQFNLDCRGQQCPGPVLAVARAITEIDDGAFLYVYADDPAFPRDLEAWSRTADVELVRVETTGDGYEALLCVGEIDEPQIDEPQIPEPQIPELDPGQPLEQRAGTGTSGTIAYGEPHQTFDMRGEQCPVPIVTLAKAYTQAAPGALLRVLADDPAFPVDLRSWTSSVAATLVSLADRDGTFEAIVRVEAQTGDAPSRRRPESTTRVAVSSSPAAQTEAHPPLTPPAEPRSLPPVESPAPEAETQAVAARERPASERCTLLVLHNDHEALLAALLVANGAASQGMDTNVFFTFWGLNLLRGDTPNIMEPEQPVGFMQRLMKWMMPRGPKRQPLGQMHFAGAGKGMLGSIMKRQNIMMLPELMRSAQELGVTFTACTMSMSVMGITRRDLYPYPNLEYGGVATFVSDARQSGLNLVF